MNGFCIWLTGIPSAGKTTIAYKIKDEILSEHGLESIILDGDEVRVNITKGLGFSEEDRYENVTRIAWMAKQIVDVGGIVIVALISPFANARQAARKIIGEDNIYSIHIDCSIKEAINRDVKGLYAQAISGTISGVTGYDAPYEIPKNADLHITTEHCTPEDATALIIEVLQGVHLPWPGKTALFIGRWSPFHNGHKYIIDKAVSQGQNVSIGVRCSKDYYTVRERIQMIQAVYPNAYVFAMPDISSINIGRLVGYDVNRHEVPDHIAGISATEIRNMMAVGNDEWENRIPKVIVPLLKKG